MRDAMEVSGAAEASNGPRDLVRKQDRMILCRAECRFDGIIIGSGVCLRKGESEFYVLNREIDTPKSLVQDDQEPQRIEQAKALFERKVSKEVQKSRDYAITTEVIESVHAKALAGQKLTEDEQKLEDVRNNIYRRTGMSWQGCFSELFDRSPKPLVSFEVVGEPEMLPEQREEQEHDQLMLKAARGGDLLEELRALRAEVDRLKQQQRK